MPFAAKTAGQNLQAYYNADDRAVRRSGIGARLATPIGCVGLWDLASFNTSRRIKEIGIRKTLGASSGDIVKLLVGQFLRPVLIAKPSCSWRWTDFSSTLTSAATATAEGDPS